MQFTWQKISLLIGFILVSIAIGFGLYYFFFKTEPISTPTEEEESGSISELAKPGDRTIISGEDSADINIPAALEIIRRQPVAPAEEVSQTASGGVTAVIDVDVARTKEIALDSTGNSILSYNQDSGLFYKIDDQGNKILLSNKKFADIENITWASKSEKAILEFPDGSNILYDFKSNKQTTLPKNWTEFDFSSSEDKIAFKDMDSNKDKRFIAIANTDGSGQKYLEAIGNKSNQININISPTSQYIATFEKSNNSDLNTIYFIGQDNENFRSIELNGYGSSMQYTPTGQQLIYSAHNSLNNNKPELYIVDASGDNIGFNHKKLNLNTWADKCTFATNDTMYCAVPKEMPDGAGWFRELADNIPDNIYQVNVRT